MERIFRNIILRDTLSNEEIGTQPSRARTLAIAIAIIIAIASGEDVRG